MLVTGSCVDVAPIGPAARWPPQKYRKLKCNVGSSGLESILVTEVTILDPCFELWE